MSKKLEYESGKGGNPGWGVSWREEGRKEGRPGFLIFRDQSGPNGINSRRIVR